MRIVEVVTAWGHKNITAINKSTFEVTMDKNVTKQGDCIIATSADTSGPQLSREFKNVLRRDGAKLTVVLQAAGEKEVIEAYGNPRLTLNHPTDLVVRKSLYICDRTLAIGANKAATDFSRNLVTKLKNSGQKVTISLIIQNESERSYLE